MHHHFLTFITNISRGKIASGTKVTLLVISNLSNGPVLCDYGPPLIVVVVDKLRRDLKVT